MVVFVVCFCSRIVSYARVIDFFFLFKQKTAYEMRISDWSSDVCSSDLSPGCCDRRWPGDIRNGRSSCRVGDAERNPGRPEGGHAPMSMPVGRGAASGEQPRRHIDSPFRPGEPG